jgi:PIN domain nuclease of toxin-antitoxin system
VTNLLDTHLLLWAAGRPDLLPDAARALIDRQDNDFLFSAASMWEIAIKCGLGRTDFEVEPIALRRGLIDADSGELAVTDAHAVAVAALPPIHNNPFDRLLIAQARTEALRCSRPTGWWRNIRGRCSGFDGFHDRRKPPDLQRIWCRQSDFKNATRSDFCCLVRPMEKRWS